MYWRVISIAQHCNNNLLKQARENNESLDTKSKSEDEIYMTVESLKKNKANNNFRPIIIDGCNIGFQHGQMNDKFSAEGLQIAYEHFKELGYENFQIVIILQHIPERCMVENDMAVIKNLERIGVLHW